ncbi:hypothetical protein D9M71_295420 [compost metagenome]
MPAVLGFERFGDLALLGVGHFLTELGHQGIRVDPVQVAAVESRTRVFGVALRQLGEIFTVLDALVEFLCQCFGSRFAADLARFDQDVANVHFVTDHGLTATLFLQLEDDEAARGADRLGDITHRHRAEHAVEGRWQLSRFTPAHLTTFQRAFACRTGDGQLSKIGTLLELQVNLLCLFGRRLDGGRISTFRGRDQDVGQTELFRQLHLAHVRGEEVLHFLLRHLNALGDTTLTHTADDHLATHLLASIVIGQAVAGQGCAELLQIHAIALGDGADGLVQLFVGDADAGAVADLQLQVFDDQAFKHLLIEHASRRHSAATLGDGLLHFTHALVQLALHDHVVIDDGHNAIQWLHRGMRRAAQQYSAQQQRAQTISKLGLHVHDNLECLCRGKTRPYCPLRRRGLSAQPAGRRRGHLFRFAELPG